MTDKFSLLAHLDGRCLIAMADTVELLDLDAGTIVTLEPDEVVMLLSDTRWQAVPSEAAESDAAPITTRLGMHFRDGALLDPGARDPDDFKMRALPPEDR